MSTTLVRHEWAEDLASHPDPAFRDYILMGITQGFRIGFDHSKHSCQPARSNMRSASEFAGVVQEYLDAERALGRIVGPIHPSLAPPGTQLSPFGVIPKANKPGKWRLIVDLSSPEGRSVNAGIEPELCSLQYLRLDEVIQHIAIVGQGALLAKMDIESAYHMVPVNPADRPLLGMQWKGQLFFDTRLPFGLRSAPKIFSAVADALQWSFQRLGVSWSAHYLDDFITIGSPGTNECQSNLSGMLSACRRLGVPVAQEKCAGPAAVLTFLGFQLDTVQMVVSLPSDKLHRTLTSVREWAGRKGGKKREVESLLGHLQHAATVVRPGRTFVRRLIERLSMVHSRDGWVHFNQFIRSDLIWWLTFMEGWNGVSMIPSFPLPSISIETDASGSWGCGACWGAQWLQWRWEGPAPSWLISPQELLPILFALAVWGAHWRGRLVECHCDNMAVVAVINSGRSRDATLMHLLRCLFFFSAHFHVQIRASHIPGVTNVAADALSRDDLPRFLQAVPEAAPHPTPVPPGLVSLLVMEQPDWTSYRWAQLFKDCCRQVSLHQHNAPTCPERRST